MWQKLTALYQRRYWLFLGLVLGWLLISLSQVMPARAASDCATGTAGDLRALLRGVITTGNLVKEYEKRNSDVYKLLARTELNINSVGKFTLSSSAVALLNCAALEGNNIVAVQLRQRLASITQMPVRRLTADRVQQFYRQRLKSAPLDATTLLSQSEQQVWAEVFALAGMLKPSLRSGFDTLANDLGLPPPSTQL